MHSTRMAIAVDGPAASGKSSTAKAIARRLGFRHVDSGALYRAATAARVRAGGSAETWTEQSVLDAARIVRLEPTDVGFTALLDGLPADEEMRGDKVTRNVSRVASMPAVREWVNSQVRKAAEEHDVVVDGRDIGTVVFPDAALKVYLVADQDERARRRLLERAHRPPTADEIAEEARRIVRRDELDAAQSAPAPAAVLIDTTYLAQSEQIERIAALAEAARRAAALRR